MSGLAGWLTQALVGSGAAMLAVLVLRRPLRRAFGARIAYALWALPLLRLALPPLPERLRPVAAPVLRASERVVVLLSGPDAAPGRAAGGAVDWPWVLTIAWAAGAAVVLGRHLLAHRRLRAQILAASTACERIGGVRVVTSAAAEGPLAFGVWRRYVALPADVAARYDPRERALVLAHELGHHARGDLVANWAALGVLAAHWFDPLAWRAFRAFRTDQEMANDARVLADAGPAERERYARAILKTAAPGRFGAARTAACHRHPLTDLKGRLTMLKTDRVSKRRAGAGLCVIAATLGAGLALSASGPAAARWRASVAAAGPATQTPAGPASVPAPPPHPEIPVEPSSPEVRNVVVVRDGKSTHYDSADIDAHLAAHDGVVALPLDPRGSRLIVKNPDDPDGRIEVQEIPAISVATCGIGTREPTTMVIDHGRGPSRKIVLCTDRIVRLTRDAAAKAANAKDIERAAYRSALDGLRKARAEAAARTGPGSGETVPALDSAIAELERDLAQVD